MLLVRRYHSAMTSLRAARRLLLAMLLVVAGCSGGRGTATDAATGSGGSSGDAGLGPLTDADPSTAMGFCLAYVGFFSAYAARCDGLPRALVEQELSDPVICARFVASIQAGRLGFDGAAAATCASSLAAVSTCAGSSMDTLAGCDQVFTPRVALGGTCASFYVVIGTNECMGDAYCKEGANYACTGVCTAKVPLGGACDILSDVRCTSGATCDSGSKTCVTPPPPASAGGACGGAGQGSCPTGFYCGTSSADGGAAGVCLAQQTSGPCTTSTQCASTFACAGPTGGKSCAPFKTVGASCTPGWRECDPLGFCGSDGKCTDTWVAAGQPCGAIGGENISCAFGAYCEAALLSSGTCQAKKQPGDACTGVAADECDGNNAHCDATSGTCVACPP
jgi:hypothetical protein